jgi:hypothetical protein
LLRLNPKGSISAPGSRSGCRESVAHVDRRRRDWVLPSEVVANSFYRISVHPDRPLEVVAATDAGGLRSMDGGATWTGFLDGLVVTDLVRTADPTVLYAATGTTQVWKSEDGGASWALRSNGIPAAGVRLSLAVSPSNPARLYAACEISGGSHVYRTTDGGQSWTDLDSVRNSRINILGTPDSGPTRSPCCRAARSRGRGWSGHDPLGRRRRDVDSVREHARRRPRPARPGIGALGRQRRRRLEQPGWRADRRGTQRDW